MTAEFQAFPKISRGGKDECVTITEKLNGTNACVIVAEVEPSTVHSDAEPVFYVAGVQSRKRLITPEDDNYGFAGWVSRQGTEFADRLGVGYHYGEWYGLGIQKNPQGLEEKRWALFNSNRWRDGRQPRPAGVECVPILYEGPTYPDLIKEEMSKLALHHIEQGTTGEGIVAWYHIGRRYEKHTFKTPQGKWAA
jgi:hypothetical protein